MFFPHGSERMKLRRKPCKGIQNGSFATQPGIVLQVRIVAGVAARWGGGTIEAYSGAV
jgi:hypothetical protein